MAATTTAPERDDLPAPRRVIRWPVAWRRPLILIGLTVLAIWAVVAIVAIFWTPYSPLAQTGARLQGPSGAHWFGTDSVGRDVLSRLMAGTHISLPVPILVVIASTAIGTAIGSVAGYFGGVVDEVLMRFTDLVLAFPTIILAMVIAAALGPGLQNAVIALLAVSWPQYARVSRSLVLSTRRSEYVLTGRLMGSGVWRSLTRDVLPNIASPLVVLATMDVGNAILLLSALSFLGLGVVPPTPEWGAMIAEGVEQFSAWWISTFAGLAIFSVVLAFNFLGDALRDALDPRTRRSVEGRSV